MFLRQRWIDSRLAYGPSLGIKKMKLLGNIVDQVWLPDLYFVNDLSDKTTCGDFMFEITQEGIITHSCRSLNVCCCFWMMFRCFSAALIISITIVLRSLFFFSNFQEESSFILSNESEKVSNGRTSLWHDFWKLWVYKLVFVWRVPFFLFRMMRLYLLYFCYRDRFPGSPTTLLDSCLQISAKRCHDSICLYGFYLHRLLTCTVGLTSSTSSPLVLQYTWRANTHELLNTILVAMCGPQGANCPWKITQETSFT